MTTSLGRAMGGVSKEEQEKLLGVHGLERLCKTFGSADYLERAMRDWSDDVVGSQLHDPCVMCAAANLIVDSFSWTSGRTCKIAPVARRAILVT